MENRENGERNLCSLTTRDFNPLGVDRARSSSDRPLTLGDIPRLFRGFQDAITRLMQSSERNRTPDLFAAKTEERNDQRRSLGQYLSSAELDGKIKELTSLIEARFVSRARFLNEFTQLRALLNAQVARAQTLADELPATYFPVPEALPVAEANLVDDRLRPELAKQEQLRPTHRGGQSQQIS